MSDHLTFRYPQDFQRIVFAYSIERACLGYRISLHVNGGPGHMTRWVPTLRAAYHAADGLKGPWA